MQGSFDSVATHTTGRTQSTHRSAATHMTGGSRPTREGRRSRADQENLNAAPPQSARDDAAYWLREQLSDVFNKLDDVNAKCALRPNCSIVLPSLQASLLVRPLTSQCPLLRSRPVAV